MELERELQTYQRELKNYLKEKGKFILIRGDQVVGVWENEEEAVEAGDQLFPLEPFLVKEIQEVEQPRFIPYDIAPKCPSSPAN